jgi:hypothetical protein
MHWPLSIGIKGIETNYKKEKKNEYFKGVFHNMNISLPTV